MLEQWGLQEAGDHLIAAFDGSTSPAFMADIYVDRGRELGVFRSDSSERTIISQEAFDRLGQILVAKIERSVADGALETAPFYFDIVRAWAHVAGAEAPRAWLAAGIQHSHEFMGKVGKGLVSYSIGTGERQYTMRDAPEPQLYELSALAEAGKRHLSSDLTSDQRNLLTEIVRGSEKLLKGQSSEGSRDHEDEE